MPSLACCMRWPKQGCLASVAKSTTAQFIKDDILLLSGVKIFSTDKFEGICNALVVPDNSVYNSFRLLKPDVLAERYTYR